MSISTVNVFQKSRTILENVPYSKVTMKKIYTSHTYVAMQKNFFMTSLAKKACCFCCLPSHTVNNIRHFYIVQFMGWSVDRKLLQCLVKLQICAMHVAMQKNFFIASVAKMACCYCYLPSQTVNSIRPFFFLSVFL